MSASSRPTACPSDCRARARLVATVDLPTPPLPLATATTCLTPGREIFGGGPPWGCMRVLRISDASGGTGVGSRVLRALRALAQLPEVLQGEDARVVAVTPGDLIGVM